MSYDGGGNVESLIEFFFLCGPGEQRCDEKQGLLVSQRRRMPLAPAGVRCAARGGGELNGRGITVDNTVKELRGEAEPVLEPKSAGGVVEDAHGEDGDVEEQFIMPWTVSVARFALDRSARILSPGSLESFTALFVRSGWILDVSWGSQMESNKCANSLFLGLDLSILFDLVGSWVFLGSKSENSFGVAFLSSNASWWSHTGPILFPVIRIY